MCSASVGAAGWRCVRVAGRGEWELHVYSSMGGRAVTAKFLGMKYGCQFSEADYWALCGWRTEFGENVKQRPLDGECKQRLHTSILIELLLSHTIGQIAWQNCFNCIFRITTTEDKLTVNTLFLSHKCNVGVQRFDKRIRYTNRAINNN